MADLPVAIDQGALDGRIDLGALEWREGEHRASAHRRLVAARDDDRCQTSFVADGAERRDCGLAHQGFLGGPGKFDEALHDLVASRFVFAARPRGDLDDSIVGIIEGGEQIDRRLRRRQLGRASAHGDLGVAQCFGERGGVEGVEAFEGAERRGSDARIVRCETGTNGVDVGGVARNDDGAEVRLGHCFNRSVRVMTSQPVPNAMTIARTVPMMIERADPATTAHTRRSSPGLL